MGVRACVRTGGPPQQPPQQQPQPQPQPQQLPAGLAPQASALEARAAMLDARIADVSATQDAIARDDEIAGAVGFIMSPAFWIVPAYKDNPAAELAALKGDRRAVALVAAESRCAPAS